MREQQERQKGELLMLREDIARYQDMSAPEHSSERRDPDRNARKRQRRRDKGRDRGFER